MAIASAMHRTTGSAPSRGGGATAPSPNHRQPSKQDYVNLYSSLKKLDVSKGAYTEALRLYVAGRRENLASPQLDDRERTFQEQLRLLKDESIRGADGLCSDPGG